MNCLAINTTNSTLSVALIKGDDTFSRAIELGKSGHSGALMLVVDKLLSEHSVDVNALDAIAVVVGPGSFTGIRIGVSAMTAIAFATGAKRIAITSFDLLAYNRGSVTCGVDAGHGNVYIAKCKEGEVLSTAFVEAKDAKSLKDVEYLPLDTYHDTLGKVARKKLEKGEFVSVFEPFYMRKSQAEREKDEV